MATQLRMTAPTDTPYEGWRNKDTHDLYLYMTNDRKTYNAV